MKRNISLALLCTTAVSLMGVSPFADVICPAIENAPAIHGQQMADSAAVAALRAENTPEGAEIEFEHLWASEAGAENKWNIGVTQQLSLPGVYRTRSRMADALSEQSTLALSAMRYDRALAVKLSIIDLVNATRRLALYENIGANLNRIASLTATAYGKGAATVLDLRKMQIAVADNERTLASLRADIATLRAALQGLGADPAACDDEIWLSYPMQPLAAGGEDFISALSAARSRTAAAAVNVARNEAWPAIGLGYRHAFEENTHFNGLSVSLRLPSYSQKKRREAARLEAEAVAFDTRAEEIVIETENAGLLARATTLANAMEHYAGLTDDDSYITLLDKAYDGGQLTVIEYLTEINLFASARIGYLDLEYDYNLALTRLGRYRSLDF